MSRYRALSLWWDQLDDVRGRPELDGSTSCDVAIVGAGLTGLWTAYYLLAAQPDLDVVIVERETVGFGASGRNGGWCSALFPSSMATLAARTSRTAARRMRDAMHETVDEVGRVVAREELDVGWSKGGTITGIRSDLGLRRAEEEIAAWRSWGYGEEHYRLVDRREAESLVAMTDLRGAVVTPHCAAVDPARLVRGLGDVVERMGARLVEQTVAEAIEPGRVRTRRGDVMAPVVIRATEAYTAELPGLARSVVPVYSLMLATEPLPAAMWDEIGLSRRQTFSEERNLIVYGQRTRDGRIAFGGRGAPYHFGSRIAPGQDRDPRVHADLWRVLVDLLPMLRDVAVTHAWGGPLAIARDWAASCGLGSDGIGWAGGYVGDGIGTSNLAGRTLADLVLGVESDLVTLPWVGHRSPSWEPEPLRWLGINAGLKAMTAADEYEARTGRPSWRGRVASRLIGL